MSTALIPGGGREPIRVPDDLPDPLFVRTHPVGEGVQAVWRFPNGRGLSVVYTPWSYDVEAMPLVFVGDGPEDYRLDRPDPFGWLDADRFVALLRDVRDQPAPEQPAIGSA